MPYGLLSPQDREAAFYQGLLSLGPALLAGGSPRIGQPAGFGQAIGQAGQAFNTAIRAAQGDALTLRQLQLQEALQGAQKSELEARTQERKAKLARQEQLKGLLYGSGPQVWAPTAGDETSEDFARQGTPGLLSNVDPKIRPTLEASFTAAPEQTAAALLSAQLSPKSPTIVPAGSTAIDPVTRKPVYTAPDKAQSDIGRLVADLQAGKISPEQFQTAIRIKEKPLMQYTNQAEDKFVSKTNEYLSKQFVERREAAQNASESLAANQEARKLLGKGVITGFGANWKVGVGKALQQVGIRFADDEIANTEAFYSAMAKQTAQIIKSFGSGTGLSDADREYAVKAAGGDIKLNEESIRRILDINDRASRNVIKRYNKEAGKLDQKKFPFPLAIEESVAPPSPAPAGQIKFLGFE